MCEMNIYWLQKSGYPDFRIFELKSDNLPEGSSRAGGVQFFQVSIFENEFSLNVFFATKIKQKKMGCLLVFAYGMLFSSIYRDYFVVATKSMQEYSRKRFK